MSDIINGAGAVGIGSISSDIGSISSDIGSIGGLSSSSQPTPAQKKWRV